MTSQITGGRNINTPFLSPDVGVDCMSPLVEIFNETNPTVSAQASCGGSLHRGEIQALLKYDWSDLLSASMLGICLK